MTDDIKRKYKKRISQIKIVYKTRDKRMAQPTKKLLDLSLYFVGGNAITLYGYVTKEDFSGKVFLIVGMLILVLTTQQVYDYFWGEK